MQSVQPAVTGPPKNQELLDDYERFKTLLKRQTNLDLNSYKFEQTYRRIWTMVDRAGFQSFTQYFNELKRDETKMQDFMDRLAINVSELFRNPEQYELLRTSVLPELLKKSGGALKVWSAGSSYGAEAYSLAILLNELAPQGKHQIIGTDIDASVLERARKGVFDVSDMRAVPKPYIEKYFKTSLQNGKTVYTASDNLKRFFTFKPHNLLADRYEPGFDMIVCRNVVIYFSDEAKDGIMRRFNESLKPGGFLFLGNTERIFNYKEIGFSNPKPFFYQKG